MIKKYTTGLLVGQKAQRERMIDRRWWWGGGGRSRSGRRVQSVDNATTIRFRESTTLLSKHKKSKKEQIAK
ncbi:hypothetical protein NECAME_16697 [Necator americanus]|uniref:Uncharacterized protein n=1 Tax=Necator americanus TaxID=51031 RepID=W2TVK7_NECAM|nr:hypothetical protein NECAME_16697 [Necator americanus]ETN85694.1 hypothetical protein NECAME_16697 [Necator americanus]